MLRTKVIILPSVVAVEVKNENSLLFLCRHSKTASSYKTRFILKSDCLSTFFTFIIFFPLVKSPHSKEVFGLTTQINFGYPIGTRPR